MVLMYTLPTISKKNIYQIIPAQIQDKQQRMYIFIQFWIIKLYIVSTSLRSCSHTQNSPNIVRKSCLSACQTIDLSYNRTLCFTTTAVILEPPVNHCSQQFIHTRLLFVLWFSMTFPIVLHSLVVESCPRDPLPITGARKIYNLFSQSGQSKHGFKQDCYWLQLLMFSQNL